MKPNPVMKSLGFADDDRAVVIHVDDLGMCQAGVAAFRDLVELGTVSSGSVMVPCPWFPRLAEYCRTTPEVDVGIHLTLTSEWTGYRWRPVSTRDPTSGLIDEEGYLPRKARSAADRADPEAIRRELEAQIERALETGIDATHLDAHMFTALYPSVASLYFELAEVYQLPPFALRLDEAGWRELGRMHMGFTDEEAAEMAQLTAQAERRGVPFFDHAHMMALDEWERRVEQVQEILETLPPGLTYFIIHAAKDTPELRAIAPDWRSRVADYRAFASKKMQRYLRQTDVHVIGYRKLRDVIRQANG